MNDLKWTDQQRAAIELRGGSLLVSAGAGSGKTFVLVQRLLSYVLNTEAPHNIDDFLVITYTRAAAAELKARIARELSERLALDPGNTHLQRQLQRIHTAKIGTAHAYCATILREYAGRLGLDPAFRITDEEEGGAMLSTLLERLLDERYDRADPDFLLLVDTIGDGRDDSKLQQAALSLYSKLQSLPEPHNWIAEQSALLLSDKITDLAETDWGRSLIGSLRDFSESVTGQISAVLKKLQYAEDIYTKYAPAFEEDLNNFTRLSKVITGGAEWEAVRAACCFSFSSFKPVRTPSDPELKDQASAIRKSYRDTWKKKCVIFEPTGEEIAADASIAARALRDLLSLTADLTDRYGAAKRARNLMDYSDLEHLTLNLLSSPEDQMDAAQEISARFTEVLVDEYQDTNEIQDRIFQLLSSGGKHLFMVGDIKQSIYRFRLADPEIFLEKYATFPDYAVAGETGPRRVNLNANFRSDPAVLSFLNRVFGVLMTRQLGGIDYTENEALRSLKADDGPTIAAEISILDTKDLSDESGTPIPREQAEAFYVAQRVRDILRSGRTVYDNDKPRPVRAGDIAILLRSDKPAAAHYAQALARLGIASSTNSGTDVLSSPEAALLLSLLRIIDNPRQDIPLVSVLHSPLYNFSADELAQIRANEKEVDIYDALKACAISNLKCADFLLSLDRLRERARILPIDELIWHVFCDTGIRELYGAMEDGHRRRANLDAIYAYASRCVSKNKTDLFSFLNAIESAIKSGTQLLRNLRGGSADSVQIMSIHRSKGLEFPIVFLSDAGRRFNTKDIESSLLSHKRLGLAARYVDMQRMVSYDTAPRVAIRDAILSEQLSEEMRVLYVALTRAKHSIHITLSGSRVQPMLSRAANVLLYDTETLKSSGSMADWLLTALMREMSAHDLNSFFSDETYSAHEFKLCYISPEKLSALLQSVEHIVAPIPAQETAAVSEFPQIERTLVWRYPYAAACNIPSKLTATQLKGRFGDTEAAQDAPSPVTRARLDRPSFITKQTGLSPAEQGTAMHLVMQHIVYAACVSREGVRNEIARLEAMEQLTSEQARSVNPDKILRFFQTEIGAMLVNGNFSLREFKFSILCPAKDYYQDAPQGDDILLQGVVDVCLETARGLIVLDFKTDRIRPGGESERGVYYSGQLRAYASALQRITGKHVDKLLLYFFETGAFAEVDPQEKSALT